MSITRVLKNVQMTDKYSIRKFVERTGTPGLVKMNQEISHRNKCYESKNISFECEGYCLVCFFFFLSFCYFFGPLPRHMEVPRLGVQSEL